MQGLALESPTGVFAGCLMLRAKSPEDGQTFLVQFQTSNLPSELKEFLVALLDGIIALIWINGSLGWAPAMLLADGLVNDDAVRTSAIEALNKAGGMTTVFENLTALFGGIGLETYPPPPLPRPHTARGTRHETRGTRHEARGMRHAARCRSMTTAPIKLHKAPVDTSPPHVLIEPPPFDKPSAVSGDGGRNRRGRSSRGGAAPVRGNVDDGAVDDGVSVTCTESDIVDIWQDLNKDQPATKHKDQPAYRKVSSPRPRPTRAQLYRPPWLPYGCHNHIGLLSRDLQPRGMSPRDKLTPTFTRQRPHAHTHTHAIASRPPTPPQMSQCGVACVVKIDALLKDFKATRMQDMLSATDIKNFVVQQKQKLEGLADKAKISILDVRSRELGIGDDVEFSDEGGIAGKKATEKVDNAVASAIREIDRRVNMVNSRPWAHVDKRVNMVNSRDTTNPRKRGGPANGALMPFPGHGVPDRRVADGAYGPGHGVPNRRVANGEYGSDEAEEDMILHEAAKLARRRRKCARGHTSTDEATTSATTQPQHQYVQSALPHVQSTTPSSFLHDNERALIERAAREALIERAAREALIERAARAEGQLGVHQHFSVRNEARADGAMANAVHFGSTFMGMAMQASGSTDNSWKGIVDNGLKDAGGHVTKERASLAESRSNQVREEAENSGRQSLQLQDPAASNKRKEPDVPLLPDGWVAHVSSTDGTTYYCNTMDGKSQWDRPPHPRLAPQSPPRRPPSPPRRALPPRPASPPQLQLLG